MTKSSAVLTGLGERLLRIGVAPRYVRRAVQERKDHYQQLFEAAVARGESHLHAEIEAASALGPERAVLDHYAAMTDTHAWSARHPVLSYALMPMVIYLLVSSSLMGGMVAGLEGCSTYLHQIRIPPGVTRGLDWSVQFLILGFIPLAVSAGMLAAAIRQRSPLHWPIVGVVLVCVVASIINVSLIVTGGPGPGEAGAGVGVSSDTLGGQSLRLAGLLAFLMGSLHMYLKLHRLRQRALEE